MSEKYLLLDMLEEGDGVMVDKGVYYCRYAREKGLYFEYSSFPFIFYSVFFSRCAKTQEIAKLRIHVERAIGRVNFFYI